MTPFCPPAPPHHPAIQRQIDTARTIISNPGDFADVPGQRRADLFQLCHDILKTAAGRPARQFGRRRTPAPFGGDAA
jgi:hypothetical protein